MNPKNLALAALVCAFMAGCGQRSGGAEGVVTVDFHSYEERQLAEMADPFYSGKRYVALHADDQELMIGEVGKIVLHGDRIYVSERAEGPRGRHILVVHDADGRALAKIGNRGRGPGEYLQISCFDVDAEGRIHIYDGNFGAKKIYIYAPDGKFIEERQLSFSADRFRCTPDGGYLMTVSTWEETEGLAGRRFAKTDAGMNVQNVAGEWDMSQVDNNVVLGEGCLISTPEGVFVIKSPDEHLYRLDGEGNVAATWILALGGYAIPPENRGNLEPLFESGMEPYRFLMDLAVPWGKYILGSMYDRGEIKSFVYDTGAGINYTETHDGPVGFNTISDGRLVSLLPYSGDKESLPGDLPSEMRAGVISGDPLLVLYSLK